MSIKVNPIRKRIVKKELKKGTSARHAMLKANYALNTAHNATKKRVVRDCMAEIELEFKMSEITPEKVLENLERLRILAVEKSDIATAKGIEELKGKYLGMWRDVRDLTVTTKTDEESQILNKYRNRFKDLPEDKEIIPQGVCNKGTINPKTIDIPKTL